MFDVIIVMQNPGSPAPAPDGLTVHPFIRRYAVSKFDLTFTFEERDSGLQADITYNTDLFLPARIKRMPDHLRELVVSVLRDATVPVARLRILPPAERQQILGIGAPPPVSFPHGETLVSLFERRTALNPESLALVSPEAVEDVALPDAGPRHTMSYTELNARANRLARHLQRLGVGPDVLVGLCLPRSLDLVVGLLGILKAGGAYLPLDAAHPSERWAFMIADARATVVLTLGGLAEKFSRSGVRIVCLDRDSATLALELADNPAPIARPDHLAYVIYTSGSTGRPKGVAVTHLNVARLFAATERLFGFGDRDVWTLFHSCAFDFSVWELWGALLYGGRAVIVPHLVSRSPNVFYELLARERVTVLNQTPSAFRQLVQVEEDTGACGDLTLRYVIFGGEALDLKSLRPWFARHGDATPRLVNMYGITETTVHVTYRPLSAADLQVSGSRIGKPLPDMKLYLLDRHREPVPIGAAGELYVGGGGVARGYLYRSELNEERFVPDPFASDPEARLYRSGDLARFLGPDDDIEYLGRIDQQVQIRGFRVELGEIESVLGAHPGVREAVVLPQGQGALMRLVGYFVPAPGEPPAAIELRRYLQARMPEYMVPATLIQVDAFTMTANGKLDREALPRPEDDSWRASDEAYRAPESALERRIAAAFQEVLGIGRVGLHDNFFDLGANSLLLVQVHRKLCQELDLDLPVISLFQYPTLAALAAHLADRQPGQPSATQQARQRAARRKAAREKRRSPSR
jgi:amino acid adenylation domain-containing protein